MKWKSYLKEAVEAAKVKWEDVIEGIVLMVVCFGFLYLCAFLK